MLFIASSFGGPRYLIAMVIFCLLTEWRKNYNNFLCSGLNLNKSHSKTFIFMQMNFKKYCALCYSLQFLPIEYVTMLGLIFFLWCPVSLKYLITHVVLLFRFFWTLYIFLSPCLWVSEDQALFFCLFSKQYFKSLFISIISILCFYSFHQNVFQVTEYVLSFVTSPVNIMLEQFLSIL